jgi:acetyl esterase/lipase
MAETFALILALGGTLGALIGLACGDCLAIGVGLCGAAIATRHLIAISAPHDSFDQAFGPGWEERIPPALRARMLQRRYTPLLRDPADVPRQRDLIYGTHGKRGKPLLCDIWEPPSGVARTGLAVIYLFGGAWHYMDKDLGTRRFFRHLAGLGHVIMDAAHTLAPKAQLTGIVADVRRAIAWLKANAACYDVNPERIVLMGCSSGAHLALLAAYTPNHPVLQPADVKADTSVRAVVSYSGTPDLRASYDYMQNHLGRFMTGSIPLERWGIAALEAIFRRARYLPPDGQYMDTADWLPSLLGGTPDQVPEMYDLGSPISHVGSHCPPTLLLQGGHDFTGIKPHVRRLHRALQEADALSIYVEYPNSEHAFDMIPANLPRWLPMAQVSTYDTERFLALMI